MRIVASVLLVFLTTFSFAQDNPAYEVVLEQIPGQNAISHNIVFVVDASSTIGRYPEAIAKFALAWDTLIANFASDELYFRTYVFHDSYDERKTKWIDAGGPLGLEKFNEAKNWVLKNTGIYSWGLKAIRMALREVCPLNNNKVTRRRLTIVLITDGGLTEAADFDGGATEEQVLDSTLKKHVYSRWGDYSVINKMIVLEQARRIKRGLDPATIVTIGIENTSADKIFSTGVKRPDAECQSWLKSIGKRYHGGYFLVKKKAGKRKRKRVS